MNKRIGISLAGLTGLVLLTWALWPQPLRVELGQITQGRFERSVLEDGKARVRERFEIATPLSGRLQRMTLREGDTVQRDQVVATLWPLAPALLDERSRQEDLERTGAQEAALQRAQANIERARAAWEHAQAELQRSETLAQQGFVSPLQNETGRLNLRLREKELESARQEEHAARHQLDQARIAQRQFSAGQLGTQRSWAIRSPVAGQVLKVKLPSEGVVQAGAVLLEVGDPRQLEVVVDVLTQDAPQIRAGSPATLSHWGGSSDLQAQVRRVEPAAYTKVSALGVEEQRVNVLLDITSPAAQWQTLGDGFKVQARILVQAVASARLAPLSALFPVGERTALYAVQAGRVHQHEVEVLARNGQQAWIRSELPVGTAVVLYPPHDLQAGDRVEPLR